MSADGTLEYLDRRPVRLARQAIAVAALAIYLGYLVYRARYTLNPEAPIFAALVYLAELHGFLSLFFYFFQVWAPRRRRCPAPSGRFTVDVFITTYNEDVALLRQTVRAAIAMRLPHRTYVCDDGRRAEVKALAQELGCGYITRADNRHAKAGNWNNAYAQTSGDLILTLDADHVVQPAFLERTLGHFEDDRVALVQVPQQYHNLDSVQHQINWDERRMYGEQDVFFDLVMPGKDHWNAAFFCGTGAVLRRSALAPHGGIVTGSITEDMHTSIVLHSEGWRSVYVNEVLVTGLAPTDVASFLKQRLRWAEGNLKIILDINPLTCRGLTIAQRISYFASMFHWTVGLPKLVYYVAPPYMLVSGTFPITPFDRPLLTIYAVNLVSMTLAYKLTSRGRGRLLMDEFFNMLNTFTLLQALWRFVMQGRKTSAFVVTSKKGGGTSTSAVLPHGVMLAGSLLAINWSLLGLGFGVSEDWFGAGIAIFWTIYNMALVVGVIRLALRPSQKRDTSRIRASFAATMPATTTNPACVGVTADLSEGGCRLLWPERLKETAIHRVALHLPAGVVHLDVAIISRHAPTRDGWYPHGVCFVNADASTVDAISDALFDAVVPELLHGLRQPPLFVRLARDAWRAVHRRLAPRAARRPLRVPARLAGNGRTWRVTTRDISASGASIVSPVNIPIGGTVTVCLDLPAGTHTHHAQVIRVKAIQAAGRRGDAWDLGLRFVDGVGASADPPAVDATADDSSRRAVA
jgi:cellulose synthase (UDP-forming)